MMISIRLGLPDAMPASIAAPISPAFSIRQLDGLLITNPNTVDDNPLATRRFPDLQFLGRRLRSSNSACGSSARFALVECFVTPVERHGTGVSTFHRLRPQSRCVRAAFADFKGDAI
ncbi:MAG TPA: hypothetical protein VHZ32_02190 [Rhizomicrobium sp.]|nr:hypothetical protein [Rhizomicrobium sp.]